jgi:hypothetical protein
MADPEAQGVDRRDCQGIPCHFRKSHIKGERMTYLEAYLEENVGHVTIEGVVAARELDEAEQENEGAVNG